MHDQTTKPMKPRDRVLAALNRVPVDRTPTCNPTSVATVELMDLVDAPFPQANREPELMARLAATAIPNSVLTRSCPYLQLFKNRPHLGAKSSGSKKTTGPQ